MLHTCLPPYLTASALSQPWKNRNATAKNLCQIFKESKAMNEIYLSIPQNLGIEDFYRIHLDL